MQASYVELPQFHSTWTDKNLHSSENFSSQNRKVGVIDNSMKPAPLTIQAPVDVTDLTGAIERYNEAIDGLSAEVKTKGNTVLVSEGDKAPLRQDIPALNVGQVTLEIEAF
jgi:hypothetical protein